MKRPEKTTKELKAEIRDLRSSLNDLVTASEQVLIALDDEMKKPSNPVRGKRIAKICNHLELHKDCALHFGLKRPLPKAKK